MPASRKSAKSRRARRTAVRSARELDQLELITAMRKADAQRRAKVRAALLTAFTCSNGRALVAFGELLHFVSTAQAPRDPR